MSLRPATPGIEWPGLEVLGVCRACGLYVVRARYPVDGVMRTEETLYQMDSSGARHLAPPEHLTASGPARYRALHRWSRGVPAFVAVEIPQDDGSVWRPMAPGQTEEDYVRERSLDIISEQMS